MRKFSDADKTLKIVRILAKSNKYQTIFSLAKEVNLKLFKNDMDLTEYQLSFLNYLNFYNILFIDIYTGDVDDIVLENEIYEDSYMFYRNREGRKPMQPLKVPDKDINQSIRKSDWIFKSKKNK